MKNLINSYSSSYFSPICFYFLVFFVLISCKSEYEQPVKEDLGYNFYPLNVGTFKEYQVQETFYTPSLPPKTVTYQFREEISEAFIGVDNQLAYRYDRFRRETENDAWVLDSAGSMQRSDYQALRTENNQIYLKITFPLKENATWNGNLFNTFNKNTYTLKNLRLPNKISNKYTFDKTLQVVQSNDSSLVSLDKRIETYAENIGLVRREFKQLTYCTIGSCIGQRIISFGNSNERVLINYGKIL